MSARPGNRPRWVDWPLALVSVMMLAFCLSYTLAYVFLVPYPGITFDYGQWQVTSIDPCEAHPGWCKANPVGLQVGDQLVAIDSLTYKLYWSDRRHVPFNGYSPGESTPITFFRDGRQQTIYWQMPVITNADRVRRLNGLLYYLPFWLVGTATLLFLRPRDRRWQLLIASNYMMAVWLAVGDVSVSCVAASSLLTHAAAWLLVPIYLHLHLLVPTPLFKQHSRRLVPFLYAIALILAMLELFQLLPGSAYYLGLLLSIAVSLGLLVWRLSDKTSRPSQLATRLMLAGLGLASGPALVLWLIPRLLGYSPGAITTSIVALAIPLWPLFYTYAIYKRRLGLLEFRVNRLLSLYSFVVLYLTAFAVVLLAGRRWMSTFEGSLVFILAVSTVFVAAAPALRAPFQRWMDRLAYGIKYNPDEVLRIFANRIPAVLERKALVSLLTDEIVPSLFIRQSALYLLNGGEADLVYTHGVHLGETPGMPQQIYQLLAEAGQYRPPPAETAEAWNELPAGPGFDWVRLAVPLERREKTTGVWLFGQRDPDDYYPQHDIALLTTLASQVAVAVENVRLHEAVQQELSERKGAEEALRKSEQRYHIVSELASDFAGAFHIGLDGTIMREWLTGAYTRITGFDVGEVDTHGFWVTLVHPDDMPVAFRHLRTLFSGQPDVCELRIVTAGGQVRWLNNSGRPVWDAAQGRVIRIYSASQDITERKRAEEALRKSEARYRAVVEDQTELVCRFRPDGRLTFVNEAYCRYFGKQREELLESTCMPFILDQDQEQVEMAFASLSREKPVVTYEHRVVAANGEIRWQQWSDRAIYDENGNPVEYQSVGRDVTERKRAEATLRESERKLRLIAENATDVIFAYDMNRRLIYVNPAVGELTGYSVSELYEKNFINWLHPEDEARMMKLWEGLFEGRSFSGEEFRIITKEGQVKWCSGTWGLLCDESGRQIGVQGHERDITERKRAEERLRREAARAEALVRTAARLNAQLDLNTVLNAVCEEAAHALGVPFATVTLYEPLREAFLLAATFGLPLQVHELLPALSRSLYDEYVRQYGPLIVVPDAQAAPGLTGNEFIRRHNVRTTVVASMLREGQVVGMLNIHTLGQVRTFDDHELALLQGLADQAAQAIANARLLEETRQHVERLALLDRIARSLSATLNLDVLLEIVHREIAATMEADAFFIALYDPTTHELDYRIRLDKGVREPPEQQPFTAGLTSSIITSKQPVLIHDFEREREHLPPVNVWGTLQAPSSWLGVPMLLGENVIGVISVQAYRPNAYGGAEVELLSTIADAVAVAIENARLYETVHTGQEQLRILSGRLMEAQEAERRSLARELHDEIGQVLTAVKANLQAIQLLPDPLTFVPRLEESIGIVDRALKQVRDLSLDLRPSLLDDFGLVPALEWYVEHQAQRSGFAAEFIAELPEMRLSPTLETACFRVAQAALTNVARHTRAKRVRVELRRRPVPNAESGDETELELVIRDDGVGFDVRAALDRAARGASLGLLAMQERVRLVGGQIEIESAPAYGTEIRARFPIT